MMTINTFNRLVGQETLHPGETIRIPSAINKQVPGYTGVLFPTDILCDTPMEKEIASYKILYPHLLR